MRFGKTLANATHAPWKAHYVDYNKLKALLREHDGDGTQAWTDEDESRFVDELVNVQLEKVHSFQAETYKGLDERTATCEAKLAHDNETAETPADNNQGTEQKNGDTPDEQKKEVLEQVLRDLDSISKDINELEKYSRICFTAFLKAAKKHDRRWDHS